MDYTQGKSESGEEWVCRLKEMGASAVVLDNAQLVLEEEARDRGECCFFCGCVIQRFYCYCRVGGVVGNDSCGPRTNLLLAE